MAAEHRPIHVLDKYLHQGNEWIRELLDDTGWEHPQAALSALRAAFQVLRDRLPPNEALDFASELPAIYRGIFLEGWRPSRTPDKEIKTEEDFLMAVESHFRTNPDYTNSVDVREIVTAVFKLLSRRLSEGEINHVRQSLPQSIRQLWP